MVYEIHGKKYVLPEKVCTGQDEMLAPILMDAIETNKDLLSAFTSIIPVAKGAAATKLEVPSLIEATIDIVKLYLWLQSKKYVRRIEAIMLIPEGGEFDADKVPEIEKDMIHADREIGIEVLGSFFPKSVGSGIFMPNSSAAAKIETQP